MNKKIPTLSEIESIKIIVCDLDGTLLNHNKEISKHTADMLISLQEKGYLLALASGRFFYELQPYIKQLKMKEHNGLAICANGLEIHDLSDDSIFCFKKLSRDESIKIIETAKKNRITCYLNYQNKYYTSLCTLHKIPIYLARTIFYPFQNILKKNHLISGLYKIGFEKDIKKEIGELHKICFISTPRKLKKLESEISKWNKPYVFYFVSLRATEITHKSVGKYEAIQHICKKKNLSFDNVIAFGDSGNDLNLIKHAKIGVAMKNAFPEVKAVANYETFKNNQNEGIYDFLKQINL